MEDDDSVDGALAGEGKDQPSEHSSYLLTRWLYLRLLGVIYLVAFLSLKSQLIGLVGSHGILPAHSLLAWARQKYGTLAFWLFPTLAWFDVSDSSLELLAWSGVALSILPIVGIATAPALLALAVLYLSLVTVGGDFTEFQSDGLLIEVTLLSLFYAPWSLLEPPWKASDRLTRQSQPSKLSVWLLRFLIFRLMFASGAVKLLSGDPTWRDLTAMSYHYETQPIPNPIAWYAYQMPMCCHKVATVGVYLTELMAPLLIFGPRKMRLVAAAGIFLVQFLIALTGNYTYLNYLTMVMCIPLLDDGFLRRLIPIKLAERLRELAQPPPRRFRIGQIAITALAVLLLGLNVCELAATIFGGRSMPRLLMQLNAWLSPFRVINAYGMFAVMTTSRPEIIFEGSMDGSDWKPYEFKAKAGDLAKPPPWVAPHMPRLDWRLWFAAMEPYEVNPWVGTFIRRLLEGSPEVLELLDRNPFPTVPPKYVRALLYDYHFTDYSSRQSTGHWWWRKFLGVYFPPVSLNDLYR